MDQAEEVVAAVTQSTRIVCPVCGPKRKKRNPTLSVDVFPEYTLYDCHHCGWSGRLNSHDPLRKYAIQSARKKQKVTPLPTKLKTDTEVVQNFFADRGITISDLSELPGLTTGEHYFRDLDGETLAVGFVYGDKKEPDAIKWRPADGRKAFSQDGTADEFYGLERLEGDEDVIIVEGEADVIALASVGIRAISVPNGAPMKVSKNHRIDPSEDGKFAYIWKARDLLLEQSKRIILAVDNDEAGEALADEIARRVGRAKCWRVKFPDGVKDPTDVIVELGVDVMRSLIDKSEPMPLYGVYGARTYAGELMEVYREGHGKGESTGFPVVDDLFTIKEGLLYVVTGYPSCGKSEFLDQIMINLALDTDWKFAVASFENPPALHIAKMAEKVVGKPFYEGPTPRMKKEELETALAFIDEHFVFLENKDGKMASIDSIIDRCKQAVMRLGVRGLIIDPYNYIEMESIENEHQSITKMLSQITTFAQAYGIAVFFVAHPMKVYPREDGTLPVPKGMHISGSAAWFAKADVGLTIHRGNLGVEVHCWKVRFKWIGKTGDTVLGYDVPTGRYFEGTARDKSSRGTLTHNRSKIARQRHWQDTDWNDDKAWDKLDF